MIHPLGAQNITVSGGLGQANFSAKSFYERSMLCIIPPSGNPTFSYYIVDDAFNCIVDSETNQTAPQTYVGPVPTTNTLTIYIYSASIDGTWQMVNYVKS